MLSYLYDKGFLMSPFQKSSLSRAVQGALCLGAAFAVQAEQVAKDSTESSVEVIEVYAQKRAQNIAEVAVAVSAISADSIERLQVKDTTQLAHLVPNFKVTNNAGEGTPPAFNIRGVGMIDYNTSTVSPIAIYADGVVSGSANNLSSNLFDVEHVEVLRGPQGTLFGRNTTGGALLVMSKQPDSEFGGYVSASVAQHNTHSIDGALNVPISDSTAFRIAFNQEDYQFSTANLHPGSPDGGLKQNNVRLMLKSTFDNVDVLLKLHQEDWTGKPKPIASNGVIAIDGSGQCTPSQAGSSLCSDAFGGQVGGTDFWDVRADTADREHDTDSWGGALNINWQINETTRLTSITGFRDLDRFHSWDSDGAGNLIEGTMGTRDKLFSQEFSIAFDEADYYWQSGIYYLNEEIDQDNSFDLLRDFRQVPDLAANAALFFYDNSIDNESFALYSQVDYQLADDYTLTVGLRYTDEETSYQAKADLDTAFGVIPSLWDLSGKVDDSELSGKLALSKKVADGSIVYASYTRGYKSGGYNAGYSTTPQQAADSEYRPEKLHAYEVGTKRQLLDNKGSLNLLAFYYDYEEQQVFVNVPGAAVPYHLLKNAGDSTIYGVEAEFSYLPNENWKVDVDVGYIPEANIGEYENDGVIVADNRLPFTSEWNISGMVSYFADIGDGQFIAQLGFDYQSEFFFDQNEKPYTEQDGYILFNGRMSYEMSEAWLLSLWGKNLTNEKYAELRFDSISALGAVTELKGEARQLGIEVKYSF